MDSERRGQHSAEAALREAARALNRVQRNEGGCSNRAFHQGVLLRTLRDTQAYTHAYTQAYAQANT